MIKSRTFRNQHYLKFIRNCNCIFEECKNDIHAHHVRLDHFGMGQKPSDYRTLPVNGFRHRELHDKGEGSYFLKHKKSHYILIAAFMMKYLFTYIQIDNEVLNDIEDIIEKYRSRSNFDET